MAIARAAGITLTWDDLSDLSAVVPLLTRIYPNGEADVNHFHAAGGIAFLVHTLLRAGLLHEDVRTIAGHGLWRYTTEPRLDGTGDRAGVVWEEGPKASLDHLGAAPGRRAVLRRRRPADAHRPAGPRGHQDLRGDRPSTAP